MSNNIEEAVGAGTGAQSDVLQSMPFFGQEQNVEQLIVFVLGDEEFGLRIDEVREIIRMRNITPIPDSPSFIKGIINVRGEIVMAIDLKSRFFLHSDKHTESRHIIISRQEKAPFGMIVDEVAEVLRIPRAQIKKAPGLVTRIHEDYIGGVLTIENRMIIVLDLPKVLSEDELVKLAELQRMHGGALETMEEAGLEEDEGQNADQRGFKNRINADQKSVATRTGSAVIRDRGTTDDRRRMAEKTGAGSKKHKT